MSAPMRKPRTEQFEPVFVGRKRFYVSSEKARAVLVLLKGGDHPVREEELVPAEEVFKGLHAKYTKRGSVLRGARLREDMSQVELAKRLEITQSDLSKMEHGRRPIGRKMAKRLARTLNIDYRVFL